MLTNVPYQCGHTPRPLYIAQKNLRPDLIKHCPVKGIYPGHLCCRTSPSPQISNCHDSECVISSASPRSAQIFLRKCPGSVVTKPPKPVSSVSAVSICCVFRIFWRLGWIPSIHDYLKLHREGRAETHLGQYLMVMARGFSK